MKKSFFSWALAAGMLTASASIMAADTTAVQEMLKQLVDKLVQQGTLTADEAAALRKQLDATPPAQAPAAAPTPAPLAPTPPGEVRVPYVPEIIKEEIRNRVRADLREDVLRDLLGEAKQQGWGLPGVIPSWVERIKWYGDMRVRGQGDFYAAGNAPNVYLDFNKVNAAGGIGNTDNPFLNVNTDRQRLRLLARLGMLAKVNDDVQAGLRLATGSLDNPVVPDQTMGRYGERYTFGLDQAYLRYTHLDRMQFPRFTLSGGRLPNPWVGTDLVWDRDLNFEGVAATLRHALRGEGLAGQDESNKMMFLTLGAFPLQEVELSSADKWLLGAQMGGEWLFHNQQSKFTLALAYYDYQNIMGQRNTVNSSLLDFTAPPFVQKGNTLFDIRNDANPNTNLWALAADYKEVNLTGLLELAYFAPAHLWLTADYVKNIGFDSAKVAARTGAQVEARTTGYQAILSVGWPYMAKHGDWRLSFAYKYLQRDAVLDAFTDSDFHLGGTDAKGYIISGEYGLSDDTWLTLRWLSADAIDGPPLGIDVLQLDVNARF